MAEPSQASGGPGVASRGTAPAATPPAAPSLAAADQAGGSPRGSQEASGAAQGGRAGSNVDDAAEGSQEERLMVGAELYFARLERALALPPEQRDNDVRSVLAAHEALEAAAQVLCASREEAAAAGPGRDERQLLAAGRYLAATWAIATASGMHHPRLAYAHGPPGEIMHLLYEQGPSPPALPPAARRAGRERARRKPRAAGGAPQVARFLPVGTSCLVSAASLARTGGMAKHHPLEQWQPFPFPLPSRRDRNAAVAATLDAMLPLYQRALDAARSGPGASPFWTVRVAHDTYYLMGGCARAAAEARWAGLSPADTTGLVREAEALLRRIKAEGVLPTPWMEAMKRMSIHRLPKPFSDLLMAHMRESPNEWRPELCSPEAAQARRQVPYQGFGSQCDGCGAYALETRVCGACKVARYCSKACQAKHWKGGHKQECRRLQQARQAAAGRHGCGLWRAWDRQQQLMMRLWALQARLQASRLHCSAERRRSGGGSAAAWSLSVSSLVSHGLFTNSLASSCAFVSATGSSRQQNPPPVSQESCLQAHSPLSSHAGIPMSARAQRDGPLSELWSRATSSDTRQAAAALQELAAARQSSASPEHVGLLLSIVEQQGSNAARAQPALALLARWARQQALLPSGRQPALLHRALAAAGQLLALEPPSEPRTAAAAVLLLGTAAPALAEPALVNDAVEAIGSALLSARLAAPQPQTAADATAAVGSALPCLMGKPAAAGWLLGALLQWLGGSLPAASGDLSTLTTLDCLAPAYGMMRGAAAAALARFAPAAAVSGLLHPAFDVLKTAAAAAAARPAVSLSSQRGQQAAGSDSEAPAAAAVLCLAGLAEGVLRAAAGYAEAAQLAAETEAALLAACEAATARNGMSREQAADNGLLEDACSLATAQLLAAALGRLPRLATAPSVALCQARSLLHRALSLAPLCQAAAARLPPAQAAQQLRQQAGSALGQQAGGLARSLADRLPSLDFASQRLVLQEVQSAARQAHQQYRRYSLTTQQEWLAAMDPVAVRQLLDRLFLSCLSLLASSWQASAAAGARQTQRAQLAAEVLVVLADLQFCRVAAAPRYAPLLTAALGEVPGDAAAASTLAASLPCYAELAKRCPDRGGQAAWLVDGVASAKVQLLMLALVPCCALLPQAALEARLAPLAFLYLLHPHRSLAAAAHQLFCSLLLAVRLEQRREPLAAFYVRRCMEGCPGTTLGLLQEFGQGLATILHSLPVGSLVGLLCLEEVLATWRQLAARGDPSAQELAGVAAQQLLLVDHALLGAAMSAFEPLLWAGQAEGEAAAGGTGAARSSGGSAQASVFEATVGAADGFPSSADGGSPAAELRKQVLAAVRATDDSLRKPALAAWLQQQQVQHGA